MDAEFKAEKNKGMPKRRTRHHSYSAGGSHETRLWKNCRRPRNGYGRGSPKKRGGGGKGVWGLPGCEVLENYEDVNDPNFDSESLLCNGNIELKAVEPEVSYEEVRKKVAPILLEYFENGDTYDAGLALNEAVPRNQRNYLLEQLVETAMEHKPSHREMASVLISDLCGTVLPEFEISKAFQNLLAKINDLILDIPDVPTLLGNFIARAVADDCISPDFVQVTKTKSDNTTFREALSRAETLLSMKNGTTRLVDNVWGVSGALRPVNALIRQMTLLLKEYLVSRDMEEASRCLTTLEVPHFHHEFVYKTVVMALEANSAAKEEALCCLLQAFDNAVLITPEQIERGFLRVLEDLPDIHKDVPLAYIILDRFLERCHDKKFISDAVYNIRPNKGRKRFVSEGDQDFLKSLKKQ